MDCPLIDFSSPEQKRTDSLLIPECVGVSSLNYNTPLKYSVTGEESNPFDFVVCQVAANTAAENDPFEMVFYDALQRQDSKEIIIKECIPDPKTDEPTASMRVDKNATTPSDGTGFFQKGESGSGSTGVKVTTELGKDTSQTDSYDGSQCNTVSGKQKGGSPNHATGVKADVELCYDTVKAVSTDSRQHNTESAEQSFLNLDDILPPDSFMNSTIDMSCFLDETLPSNPCPALVNDTSSKECEDRQGKFACIRTERKCPEDFHDATSKSDEELKLTAQRQIEKIICKAELEAKNDRQDTLAHLRRSINALSSISPPRKLLGSSENFSNVFSDIGCESPLYSEVESLSGFCSFLSSSAHEKVGKMSLYNEVSSKADKEASQSLFQKINQIQEQNGMYNSLEALSEKSLSCLQIKHWPEAKSEFDWGLSDLTSFKKSSTEGSGCGASSCVTDPFELEKSALPCKVDNSYSGERIVEGVASSSLIIQTRLEKGVRRRSLSADPELTKKSSITNSPASPVLLTLPLCEDAVRNLSLCSKLSPGPSRNVISDKTYGGGAQTTRVPVNLKEKNPNQPKLFLRKPTVQSKTQSKMAPMKATAPIQNMTRVKSSPLPASKRPDVSNIHLSGAGRSTPKEQCSKVGPSMNSRGSLGMAQSPRHHIVNGSPKNVSSQGSKLPSRLPSPRKSTGTGSESMQLKKKPEFVKERSSQQLGGAPTPFVSSPKIARKSSPCVKSGNHVRVLTDINSCQIPWKSPRRRLNQLDPLRRSRSLVNEKENL